MEAPFTFGKIVFGSNFANRTDEINHLITNFNAGINCILLSPRRWGKSSLVLKATEKIKKQNKKIRIAHIDLYNIRSEEEFYKTYTESVLKATSNKLKEAISHLKTFLKHWTPKISFSADDQNEYKIGLEWQELKKEPDEIIDLPENIASSKKVKIIICIDEFQNIGFFEDPLSFQKKLRSHWQKHHSVVYCLYGSKRHMLIDVFASPSMPFYKFGDLIFLEKISNEEWIKYIVRRFKSTGKSISRKNAAYIARLVECHPYYVQQLATLCWFRSQPEATEQIVEESFESLMLQLSLLFQGIVESLPNTQINFLKALIDKVEKLSSKETIIKYKLGTSAGVLQVKKALINKEIIDDSGAKIFILDPVFSAWLKKFYFKE